MILKSAVDTTLVDPGAFNVVGAGASVNMGLAMETGVLELASKASLV